MKIRIGSHSIDFNEEVIRKSKKEAYIKDMTKSLAWTGIDGKTITKKVTEVYDTVKQAKK